MFVEFLKHFEKTWLGITALALLLNTDQYAKIFRTNNPDRFQFNINHIKNNIYKGKKIDYYMEICI